jgi:hypothetical protein
MTAAMEPAIPTVALYALGAVALAAPTVMLKSRLQLSKAKHRSLGGHARLSDAPISNGSPSSTAPAMPGHCS